MNGSTVHDVTSTGLAARESRTTGVPVPLSKSILVVNKTRSQAFFPAVMASRSEVWLLTPSGVVNSRPSQNQRVSRRFLPTSTRHVSQRLISNIVNEPLTLVSSPIRFLDLPGIPNTPLTYIGTLSNAADPTGATRRRAFLHLARPEPPPKHSSKHPTFTRVATDLLGQNSGHLLKENQHNRGDPYPPHGHHACQSLPAKRPSSILSGSLPLPVLCRSRQRDRPPPYSPLLPPRLPFTRPLSRLPAPPPPMALPISLPRGPNHDTLQH